MKKKTNQKEKKQTLTPFSKRVLDIVKKIPKGKTLTYGEVARLAGSPRASRAVGNLMKANHNKSVPCHRVTKADGNYGKYNSLQAKSKAEILEREKNESQRKKRKNAGG